jgi:hypothetical protein
MESPSETRTYLIPSHAKLFEDVPHAASYLVIALVCDLLCLPLTNIIASTMLDNLLLQKLKLKAYNYGGDNLKQSVIRVLGKDHPCIPTLNLQFVSAVFWENLPFHAHNIFVDQLNHCLGSPFDGSLSSTVLLKTQGKHFVIHRVVRPPMQAKYHLIDLHLVASSNDSHGIRAVCYHTHSLARLIHRIWWYYLADMKDQAIKNHGLVSLQIVTVKLLMLPSDSSIARILNGLGSPVPFPNDLADDSNFCEVKRATQSV